MVKSMRCESRAKVVAWLGSTNLPLLEFATYQQRALQVCITYDRTFPYAALHSLSFETLLDIQKSLGPVMMRNL